MAKRKVKKNTAKQPESTNNEAFQDHEFERQSAAIRALRDMEIEQLQTMLRLLRSNFSEEQLQVPLMQFLKENLPNISIEEKEVGQYEVGWKDKDGNISLNQADDNTLHTSLLHRLSMAYPDYSTGIASLGGFEFSNKSVKTGYFDAAKLQIRSLVLDEPSDSQIMDGLQTPDANNNRLYVGMTPKTLRIPKQGEMLLSVHGSPLGVYKEDNMETIQETEDG